MYKYRYKYRYRYRGKWARSPTHAVAQSAVADKMTAHNGSKFQDASWGVLPCLEGSW